MRLEKKSELNIAIWHKKSTVLHIYLYDKIFTSMYTNIRA